MHRLLLHVPVGAAVALLTRVSDTLAAIFALLFVVYELNQDRHKKDRAYLDIVGAAWGVALGGLLLLILNKTNAGRAKTEADPRPESPSLVGRGSG